MEKQELDIEKFISLITQEELSKRERAMWLDIVRDYAPSDIISTVQIYTEEGRKSLNLIYRKVKAVYEYTIPLSRDLLVDEAETIVQAWDAYYPGEFEIETSTTPHKTDELPDFEFENPEEDWNEDYELFAEELSKLNHQNYLKRLQSSGWRYGTEFSNTNKTTPVMMPWEQLPEKYKIIDMDYAAQVLELLENLGYNIEEK